MLHLDWLDELTERLKIDTPEPLDEEPEAPAVPERTEEELKNFTVQVEQPSRPKFNLQEELERELEQSPSGLREHVLGELTVTLPKAGDRHRTAYLEPDEAPADQKKEDPFPEDFSITVPKAPKPAAPVTGSEAGASKPPKQPRQPRQERKPKGKPAEQPVKPAPKARAAEEPTMQVPIVHEAPKGKPAEEPTMQVPIVHEAPGARAAEEPTMQVPIVHEAPKGKPAEEPTMQVPVVHEPPRTGGEEPTVLLPHLHQQETGSDKEDTQPLPTLPKDKTDGKRVKKEKPPKAPKAAKPPKAPGTPEGPETAEPKKHRGIGAMLGIVAGLLVLALVAGVFVYGLILKNNGKIYPNVYVTGIDVGGMNEKQALAAVENNVLTSYTASTLKVQLPDRTLSFGPEETNILLDPREAVAAALKVGRSGNPFTAVTGFILSSRGEKNDVDLKTVLNLDTDYIRSTLETVAEEITTESQPTEVEYDEQTESLRVRVGYPERSLDVEELYQVICNQFMNGDFETVVWDYNEEAFSMPDLTSYAEGYGEKPQDAVYDEETHTIVESVPGFGFDLEQAEQTLLSAAPGCELTIELTELEPQVTTEFLEKEMFGQELFTYSTEYVNNEDRTANLTLACRTINGLILNPGEVFSFNNVVGERTAEKGYRPATVYSGGASLQELGGGVCQVASTLYYATLHLDLEQVHREPHQFAVNYVPYGMDATVYWGHIDYQFKNTLSHPIKILADTENGSVNVTFLGIPDNDNKISMSYEILETYPWAEVEEVDETKEPGYRAVAVTPYTGYRVATYKTVYDADGKEISREQEAISTYEKRDQTVIVGPAAGYDPNPNPWEPDPGEEAPNPNPWEPDPEEEPEEKPEPRPDMPWDSPEM